MEGRYVMPDIGTHHEGSTGREPPQVKMANDSRLGDDGPGGMMQHENGLYADANMADASDLYGQGDTLGEAPYYGIPQIDPNLSKPLDDKMADIDLQDDSNDVSPTQAYVGDASSAAHTPPTKPKRTLSKRNNKGKQKQSVAVEDPESQVPSEDEDEDEDDVEPEDDSDDEFTPEPAVAKKSAKKTPSKRRPAAPKTPNSGATPRRAARKSAGRSARRSAAKPQDEIPFNRQRRAPKNGIMDARPIARCYDECDEADKALLDLRERELKTWKEIRVVWEEMTGHKTGNSTLPNRYERLKDNFSIIKEEDRSRLLEAKDKVEKEFNEMKWTLIAETIEREGGDMYTPDNLQRQYKKLMVKEGLRPPPGIVDADFKIVISEDEEVVDEDDDSE